MKDPRLDIERKADQLLNLDVGPSLELLGKAGLDMLRRLAKGGTGGLLPLTPSPPPFVKGVLCKIP